MEEKLSFKDKLIIGIKTTIITGIFAALLGLSIYGIYYTLHLIFATPVLITLAFGFKLIIAFVLICMIISVFIAICNLFLD